MNINTVINTAFEKSIKTAFKDNSINPDIFENLEKLKNEVIYPYFLDRKNFSYTEFVKIGQIFFNKGIYHTEILKILDSFTDCFLDILIRRKSISHYSFLLLKYKIQKMKDFISIGYLNGYIEKDVRLLKIIYEKEEGENLCQTMIKSHILWTFSIIDDIKNLSKKPSVFLEYNTCEFSKLFENFIFSSSVDKNMLNYFHIMTHKDAKEIYLYINKKDFSKLLHIYMSLMKNTLSLLNLLSVLVIQENIHEIKIDPLTKLLNRRAMEEILEHNLKISQIAGEPFTVAMADIDNFKQVNDTYGHIVGDCVLKNVARLIKESIRKSDFVFRYGGEEFLILLPSTKLEDAVNVLEKIRRKVETTDFICNDTKIRVTISIGVHSETPKNDTSIFHIIKKADKNLYKAKETGKNKVVFEGE